MFHLRLITFGGRSAHLAYHVHKRGRKTSIIVILNFTTVADGANVSPAADTSTTTTITTITTKLLQLTTTSSDDYDDDDDDDADDNNNNNK